MCHRAAASEQLEPTGLDLQRHGVAEDVAFSQVVMKVLTDVSQLLKEKGLRGDGLKRPFTTFKLFIL